MEMADETAQFSYRLVICITVGVSHPCEGSLLVSLKLLPAIIISHH